MKVKVKGDIFGKKTGDIWNFKGPDEALDKMKGGI